MLNNFNEKLILKIIGGKFELIVILIQLGTYEKNRFLKNDLPLQRILMVREVQEHMLADQQQQ